MYRVSTVAVVAAVLAVSAPAIASQSTTRVAHAAARSRLARNPASPRPTPGLAQMDLTPKDYLVRPYGRRAQIDDGPLRTAIDYRPTSNGPVMSLGYHRFDTGAVDPSGVSQRSASQTLQPRNSVGALVTYAFK